MRSNSELQMGSDLFIFAGEKSGDLHGEKLLEALFAKKPDLQVMGVAGPLMRTQPIECILPMEEFQVMGFIDVFRSLPKLRRQFYFVADTILKRNPKVVVTIDYPGFNLRLARHLKKKGFKGKLVHFICPSVWAHGKGRISLMAKNLDLLLCILPFETALFEGTRLKACFVGHPLSERLSAHIYKPLPFHSNQKILSLFPGSRKKEIERNLRMMLEVCLIEKKKGNSFQVAFSVSEERFRPLIQEIIEKVGADRLDLVFVPSTLSYELMKASYLAIAKSGTVTLELAFHGVPTVVIYAVSFLDQLIAYHLLRIRLRFYCLVNIIAGEEVFPELIGSHLTLPHLVENVDRLLEESNRQRIGEQCQALVKKLSTNSASQEAASEILKFFLCR